MLSLGISHDYMYYSVDSVGYVPKAYRASSKVLDVETKSGLFPLQKTRWWWIRFCRRVRSYRSWLFE
ncbi:hypothetical protein HA466_0051920 [Hirschfeldia incana]|nr:hypothetical protein HA466_0051920 [Hirschfeldia incana]